MSGLEPGLEIYYDFVQNAGTTIADLIGNNHDGAFQGLLNEASWVTAGGILKVSENAPNGTVVGRVEGVDPDFGDTLTYSLVDSTGGASPSTPGTAKSPWPTARCWIMKPTRNMT
ncbi:MAG: cadherin repeat domain-containing protein [Desulfobacterales bacterium]